MAHVDLDVHYPYLGYLRSLACCLKLFDGGLYAFGKDGTDDAESPDHSQGWVVQPLHFWFVFRSGRGSGCTGDVGALRFLGSI